MTGNSLEEMQGWRDCQRQGDREEHLAQQNDGDKRDDDMEGVRYVNIIIVGIQMGFA